MRTLKTKILSIFLDNHGKMLTGGDFERKLGVSRSAVWKAVKELRSEGFLIESKDRCGYLFQCEGDVLCAEIIRRNLKTKQIGKTIEILESVDSTNTYLKRKLPLPEGYTVIANQQTDGHGRRGRPFHSPSGGIYISTLLKPDILPQDIQFLTICAAVAVLNALQEICCVEANVKWINDIFYEGKKLCGISTEAMLSAEILGVEHVIIGIGINISNIPDEVKDLATSVEKITGKRYLRNTLLAAVLNRLEECCNRFIRNGKQDILQEYKKHLFILDKHVTVFEPSGSFDAIATDITDSGALIVKSADGTTKVLNAGEISIKV